MRAPYPPMSPKRIRHLVPALAVVIALSQSTTGGIAATNTPAPHPDLTHPRVMQQAAAEVATAKTGPLTPFTPLAPRAAIGGARGTPRRAVGGLRGHRLHDPAFLSPP